MRSPSDARCPQTPPRAGKWPSRGILDAWSQPSGFRQIKMALGWACYWIVMLDPRPLSGTGFRGWMLSWAGYYADPPSRGMA